MKKAKGHGTDNVASPVKSSDLMGVLKAANPKVKHEEVMARLYRGVVGFNADELRDHLSVPDSTPSLFDYLPVLTKTYVFAATQMIRIEVARMNRPMSLDEIYTVIDKYASIAGQQAKSAAIILRVNLIAGESL